MARTPAWIFPVAGILFVALWQWATVQANYGGNWTALFCTGSRQKLPPLDGSEHIYLFKDSPGYDGQFYHYIAHDPFLRSDLKNYVDDPRLRYRRILIPLAAYGFALGDPAMIDRTYELVCLFMIELGVYWSCKFAQGAGLSAVWGLLFLLMPGIPVTVDRLVVDGAFAAFTAAFVYYSPTPSWKLFLALACAVLTRETGLVLVLAYCASQAWYRQFRTAGIFLLSSAPALAWFAFVQAKTIGKSYVTSLLPLSAVAAVVRHPSIYPNGTPLVHAVIAADYLALAGMLLAFALALIWFVRLPFDPLCIAAAAFAVLGLVLQRADLWQNVYHYGRLYTPMLVCLSAVGMRKRNPWPLFAVALMLPRIAIQLTPQLLGILHWIA